MGTAEVIDGNIRNRGQRRTVGVNPRGETVDDPVADDEAIGDAGYLDPRCSRRHPETLNPFKSSVTSLVSIRMPS
jgi:hypothetical protein